MLAEQASAPREKVAAENKLANLEKFFEEMSAHSEKIPLLPEEAFARESFYQDHD